jgi:hypothetical protein
LRVVEGDVRDAPTLDRAVAEQDAVIATFGPRTVAKTDIQEVFMRHLVLAMRHRNVRRLVNLSAWVLAARQCRLATSLCGDTNVCPALIKDLPARGYVRASIDGKGCSR